MADLTVTAANVVAAEGADVRNGRSGGTITAGQVVYKDPTDNKVKLADSNGQATAEAKGIALNSASLNQPISWIAGGNINPGATVAEGEIYAVSSTAGGIAPEADLASDEWVTTLGIGTSTSNIKLKINIGGKQVP